jgi:hypothetical protein
MPRAEPDVELNGGGLTQVALDILGDKSCFLKKSRKMHYDK